MRHYRQATQLDGLHQSSGNRTEGARRFDCLMGDNRERFERELSRLRGYDFACVVCECSLADLIAGRYRSEMNPRSVTQSVLAFMTRYRLPFVFADDRQGGELVTYSILAKYAREIEMRFKALRRSEKGHSKHCRAANR